MPGAETTTEPSGRPRAASGGSGAGAGRRSVTPFIASDGVANSAPTSPDASRSSVAACATAPSLAHRRATVPAEVSSGHGKRKPRATSDRYRKRFFFVPDAAA